MIKIKTIEAVAVEQRFKAQLPRGVPSCDLDCGCKGDLKSIDFVKTGGLPMAICNFRVSNPRVPKITGRYESLFM